MPNENTTPSGLFYRGGAFAENIRAPGGEDDLTELRASMKMGWDKRFPALRDENGVVLVGHRRLKVAAELGIEPVIETLTLGDGETADAERLRLAIVSNLGGKPMTKEDRRRIAERLYGGEWTMQRIAEALNVSKATISCDLSNCSTVEQLKPAKTASNPKGAGRPKGSGRSARVEIEPEPPKDEASASEPKPLPVAETRLDQPAPQPEPPSPMSDGTTGQKRRRERLPADPDEREERLIERAKSFVAPLKERNEDLVASGNVDAALLEWARPILEKGTRQLIEIVQEERVSLAAGSIIANDLNREDQVKAVKLMRALWNLFWDNSRMVDMS